MRVSVVTVKIFGSISVFMGMKKFGKMFFLFLECMNNHYPDDVGINPKH